jgi:homoserine kinase type II
VAVLTALHENDAREMVAHYGLHDLRAMVGVPAGSVNSNFALSFDGRQYFLRLYEERDLPGARREAAMLRRLAGAGVPTPPPLVRTDGGLVSELCGKPAALFPWRDGAMRCQSSVTGQDARKVGAALAAVHRAGAGEPCELGRFRYEDLLGRLETIAARNDELFNAVVPILRAELDQAHASRDRALPRGLTHGDLFRDNVLWNDRGDIAALLDFESACDGTFAYDLMVTVLAWCVGDDLDLSLSRAMLDGYQSVRPLDFSERAALWVEGCFAALRFTITRITDYALRTGHAGPRVVKDWRRFMMRFEKLKSLGADGFLRALSDPSRGSGRAGR